MNIQRLFCKGIIIILLIVSCKKDHDIPTPYPLINNSCLITEIQDSADKVITSIEYNSDHKPVKISQPHSTYTLTNFTYKGDSIIETSTNQGIISVIRAKITSGRIQQSTGYFSSSNLQIFDTSAYEYDGEGYLIKKTSIAYASIVGSVPNTDIQHSIITYVISNGNTISETMYIDDTFNPPSTTTTTYEYYLDKSNRPELGLQASPLMISNGSFYGKANTNLLKKTTTVNNATSTYVYETDPAGYVTKVIANYGSSSSVNKYVYKCE